MPAASPCSACVSVIRPSARSSVPNFTEGTQFGNDPIFDGLPKRLLMGRYHSWVVSRTEFPAALEVTAVSDDGQIMGLRHRHYNIHGIQFHPESVLTPMGSKIVENWLKG